MARAGKSLAYLSQEFGKARSTISGIINRWKDHRTNESKPPTGRRPLTTEHDKRQLQAVKKLFVNNKQAARQLAFTTAHLNWNVDDWPLVLWTNKPYFELGKNSKAILNEGPSSLHAPPGQRNTTSFIENVYEKGLQPFMDNINEVHRPTLMEDNAPVHTTILRRTYQASHGIKKIKDGHWYPAPVCLVPPGPTWHLPGVQGEVPGVHF
ncbi:uncharacterized protein PGTG_08809 [Puccinia graminis f. sp. tritici CRL 75-36-700-3]|uniref:Tc1-like transposase DDE domain-containing protein n=1 Tax=Puccinia graminis f. sp. tritici (strain CRL 75-36-700-3 / race SCCL) TaxID=418459 RepID=E3KE80_PUCGT|nr:uncharacterized protein PGTG_08809 [Puccinia graminis f. sp. tritici CRL 75-36-700-3]EFP82613.2 hypothetical protein PGTG_08809 [Puccinia graminis f. sp. tritici CRL 75-36-700-3]